MQHGNKQQLTSDTSPTLDISSTKAQQVKDEDEESLDDPLHATKKRTEVMGHRRGPW